MAAKDAASVARDDGSHLQEKLTAFEADLAKVRGAAAIKAASVPPPRPATVPVAQASAPHAAAVTAQVESMLARIEGLREMLATAAIELSQLHSDEVALGKKRSRVLSDACALLESRLTVAPVVDISEVADLIESLRPPKAPKVE